MEQWEIDLLLIGLEEEAGGSNGRPRPIAERPKATPQDIAGYVGRHFGGS